MSYFRASTSTDHGWRPGTLLLGNLERRHAGPDWKTVAAQHDAAIRAGRQMRSRAERVAMARMHDVDAAARGDRTRVRTARLSGLGDPGFICDPNGACSPCDTATDQSGQCVSSGVSADQEAQTKASIFNIGGQLQQANQKLLADENAVRAMLQAGTPASPATANALMQLRNEFESILDKYTTAYRALFGTTPSGFSGLRGLGLEPVTLGIVVTAIAAIGAALVIWWQHEANVSNQVQVDQTRAQTVGALTTQAGTLQQQIADAQSRGDSAKVAELTAQYNQLLKLIASNNPNQNDFGKWAQSNWGWLAAALGGIVLVSRL